MRWEHFELTLYQNFIESLFIYIILRILAWKSIIWKRLSIFFGVLLQNLANILYHYFIFIVNTQEFTNLIDFFIYYRIFNLLDQKYHFVIKDNFSEKLPGWSKNHSYAQNKNNDQINKIFLPVWIFYIYWNLYFLIYLLNEIVQ
jgi:hypothetical protein